MTKLILDCCNNHLGDVDIIIEMINQASRLKAEYVKFQLYNSDKLNPDYPNYRVYLKNCKKCEIRAKHLKAIYKQCKLRHIKPMFTIFSSDRLGFLESNWPSYEYDFALKIASSDMDNENLIGNTYRMFSKREVFVSTGMHSETEIDAVRKSWNTFKGIDDIHWLYCVSKYPTLPHEINFTRMKKFDGFSDHTQDNKTAMRAININMGYIEMHFTLGKALPSKDNLISRLPHEVEELTRYIDYLESIEKYKRRWI